MPNRAHKSVARHKPKRIHKSEYKHYLPYLPMLFLTLAIFVVNIFQPLAAKPKFLAYATEMSASGLLDATNTERAENNKTSLKLNSKLASAAQAKANDMVKRDYWSHNTPDGKEPWVFISQAGYTYKKAGENLAYGFLTSSATVSGWMSSASHKANMLDSAFSEVGFGYANSNNFNDDGKQTVVVAMYGSPKVLAAESSQPVESTTNSEVKSEQKQVTTSATPKKVARTEPDKTAKETSFNSEISDTQPEPQTETVARIQTFSRLGNTWSVFVIGLLTGIAVVGLLFKHAIGAKHFFKTSERFILHHPLLDTVMLSLVLIGSILLQTTGFIR